MTSTVPDSTLALKSLPARDRWIAGSALLIVLALSWWWIYVMARDMNGPMTGPAAWMMTAHWDGSHLLLLFAMWTVMMVAMMLPSAVPTILLYARMVRADSATRRSTVRVYTFAAGYLLVWTLFSAAATAAQRLMSEALLLTPMMEPAVPALAAGLLLAAGIYQLLPPKRASLASCHSCTKFLVRHWRPGVTGAFLTGFAYGRSCIACCGLLMLLLFAGGVMNLALIAALTLLVLIEKVAPFGPRTPVATGLLLLGMGCWLFAR